MYPNAIINAANTVERMRSAARKMGADEATLDDLTRAEALLRECWVFASDVAETRNLGTDSATRLLSAVLGFEARVTGTGTALNMLEAYHRQR